MNITTFYGTAPRQDPRQLAQAQAQMATNADLRTGKLVPYNVAATINHTNTVAGAIQSIYHFATGSAAPKWIEWLAANVNVVRGATANNTGERTYFTGDGTPKKIDATMVDVAGNLSSVYEMGLPQPPQPSAGATPNGDAGLNVTTAYVVTYVSAWGEEGEPSLPSAEVTFDSTAISVNITGLPNAAPAGFYSIPSMRIYRLATGLSGSQYQFVAEIPLAATYTDTIATSALGEALSTTGYTAPPTAMEGLIAMPNGMMAAYRGSDLMFSVPYQPHAWPVSYMLSVNYPIMGLSAFGNSLLVTTTDTPYIVTGTHPSAMTMQKLEVNQSCVSKRSVVDMGYYAAYASPDGLVAVSTAGATVKTLPLITREQWQALNPSSIHAYFWDGRYVAFYDATPLGGVKGGFILDPDNPDFGFVWLDKWFVTGYSDSVDDSLYLLTPQVGGVSDIVKWNSGTALTQVWKSKKFVAPYPMVFSAAQVRCSAYPMTLKVFADGVLKHTQTAANDQPFRLPAGFRGMEWEVEITGANTVYSVAMAQSMGELAQV